MDSNTVQLAVFLGLTALVALATWWRYGKEAKAGDSAQDFFLAGKHLSWPFIAGSLLLTNISAEQIVGMNGAQNMLQVWWEFGAAAGLLVLAGVILGLTVAPAWFALSAFVGAGLTFAGLTGWCGMANLLAMMPWNRRSPVKA